MASKKQSPKTKVAEAKAPVAAPVTKAAATKTVKPAAEPAVAKKAAAPKAVKPAAVKAEVKTPAVKQAAEAAPAAKVSAVKTSKVTFTLPKEAVETAETVALVGDFNNWDATKSIALKKQKDGSFATSVELEKGRAYQFRFLINGKTWENAWNAESYAPTPFGEYNSVVSVG